MNRRTVILDVLNKMTDYRLDDESTIIIGEADVLLKFDTDGERNRFLEMAKLLDNFANFNVPLVTYLS